MGPTCAAACCWSWSAPRPWWRWRRPAAGPARPPTRCSRKPTPRWPPGHPSARRPGGRPGHRSGGLGGPGPVRYLRHAARRGHRHLAGAAAGRCRPHPGVRRPPPVPGRVPAVHHERRGHPGQRDRGHGFLPAPPGSLRPGGRPCLPVSRCRRRHSGPPAGGDRPVDDQLKPDRPDHHPADRRAGGGRALGGGRRLVGDRRHGHRRPGADPGHGAQPRSRPRRAPPGPRRRWPERSGRHVSLESRSYQPLPG